MPAVMTKPSFESFGKMKGKKGSKEKKGGGSGDESGSPNKKAQFGGKKRPGGKRSFMQKVKRFEKQGRLGKGSKVEAGTYSYYVRILEQLKNDEYENEEDRDILVENSLSMAEGEEVLLASNQLVSRVLENLLPLASEERIEKFAEALSPSLRILVSDPYASHVIEKLLELTSSDKWRSSTKLTAWFEKTAMFVLNNFEDFTFDTYANFVMKKTMECLSGNVEKPVDQHDITSKKGSTSKILRMEVYGMRTRNAKWEKLLQDFAKRFASWPQFNDLKSKVETSRLIQNMLQAISRTENSEELLRNIIVRILAILPETITPEDVSQRILEVAFSVADAKTFGVIYEKCYKGRLAEYSQAQIFTVQKLVAAAPSASKFTEIFTELFPHIDTILKEGKTVVIANLASQCAKYEMKQKELWNAIKKAFKNLQNSDGEQHKKILWTLLTIKPGSTEGDGKFSTSYYGSAIIQHLLDFKEPILSEVLGCFDELTTKEIMKICLDPKASFVITKIYKTWQVPQKGKEKLFSKLLKDLHLVELATTKFGSRIIDLIWIWANIEQKAQIAEVLGQRIPMLSSNNYGRFMVETMGLQAFVRNKKEWVDQMKAKVKREQDGEKIAAELADGNFAKTPKKDKKRKSEVQESVEGTPSKKNKKGIKVEEVSDEGTGATPKQSKKNRKSQLESANLETSVTEESMTESTETPKKKKKNKNKNRNSDANQVATPNVAGETPGKNKKRKSEMTTDSAQEVESTPNSKKKNRASKKF